MQRVGGNRGREAGRGEKGLAYVGVGSHHGRKKKECVDVEMIDKEFSSTLKTQNAAHHLLRNQCRGDVSRGSTKGMALPAHVYPDATRVRACVCVHGDVR